MSDPITVRLDVRTKNPLNGSQGRTRAASMARAAERKKLRAAAYGACYGQTQYVLVSKIPFSSPGNVTLTRIAPRPLDDDGWQSAAKPIRDGVADYLGIKDNDPRVTWRYGQRKGRVREYAVIIEIAKSGGEGC